MQLTNTTQLELAEYVGVTQTAVSNWCQGIKLPRMDKIDKICSYFNIKRSDLMDLKPNPLEGLTNIILPAAYALPILGSICAGNGILCEENYEGVFYVDKSIKATFCLTVSGDSMVDAGIHDKDIAFISNNFDYRPNVIYAVRIEDSCEAVLKKVVIDGDNIILSPCNVNYAPIIKKVSDVTLIGECVGTYHATK